MKYCQQCGTQMDDDSAFCPNCGTPSRVDPKPIVTAPAQQTQAQPAPILVVAKVFMIIGCVASAFCFLFPLCWTIPMTVCYCNALNNRRPIGVGFKVCTLLFVSTIAGILMLCDSQSNQ